MEQIQGDPSFVADRKPRRSTDMIPRRPTAASVPFATKELNYVEDCSSVNGVCGNALPAARFLPQDDKAHRANWCAETRSRSTDPRVMNSMNWLLRQFGVTSLALSH
jgi:hypothetical protein